MPSRLSKLLQGTAVTSLTAVGAFFVWTKHCKFEDMDPATDPTFQSTFYKKFNATPNPTLHDVCVRRIPIFKIRPELLEDSANGGTKLIEGFCAGVWGGFGYTIQRLILSAKYRSDPAKSHQLWTPTQLLHSPYAPGTEITDHFVVLSKSPTAILFRCGDSPLESPDGQRESDGLFEIAAQVHADEGFAEFRLKSVFYQGLGTSKTGEPPVTGALAWLHRQYAKLWMESAVRNVMR